MIDTSEPTNGAIFSTVSLLTQDVAVLKREIPSLQREIGGLANKFDVMSDRLGQAQRTPWQLILSSAALVFVLIGGGWKVVDLQSQLTVAQTIGPIREGAQRTDQDLSDLHRRADANAANMGQLRERVSRLETHNIEIETQFRALDEFHNLARVDEMRFRGLIWPRLFDGQQYPPLFYAPKIGMQPPAAVPE